MKKFLIILGVLVFSLYLFNRNSYDLLNDAIRFRVISNSNSPYDLLMKEKVVYELSDILFKDGSKNEIKDNINSNISIIEDRIDSLFDNNNYDKSYNIVYGMNEFPEKTYNNMVFPSGKYESLVINIGEAKGDNYWCFLYPSLCMVEENNDSTNVIVESRIYNFFKDLFM